MNNLQGIGGILFDLEGVLYVGNQVIEGAVDTIRYVQAQQLPHRYVTNTTTKSRQALSQKLQFLGFPVEPHEILSPPAAACVYLRQRQPRSGYFLVSEAVRDEFREFATSETKPEVVIIGDIGRAWTYDLVNQIFQLVMAGAELIALHKGKYWQTPSGLRVDIGAFIAGLEYVTGVEATVIGKPSIERREFQVTETQNPHLLPIGKVGRLQIAITIACKPKWIVQMWYGHLARYRLEGDYTHIFHLRIN